MKIYLQVNVEPDKIMRNRGLGNNGKVAMEMANCVKNLSDPYVPMKTGMLKNRVKIIDGGKRLLYPGPYANYQHEGIVWGPNFQSEDGKWHSPERKHPTNRKLTYSGAPDRGDHWEKRMMADRGKELENHIEEYIKELGG